MDLGNRWLTMGICFHFNDVERFWISPTTSVPSSTGYPVCTFLLLIWKVHSLLRVSVCTSGDFQREAEKAKLEVLPASSFCKAEPRL